MQIDRWNAGTLRRYHTPGGAVIVTNTNRSCSIIPVWCPQISAPLTRAEAALLLRRLRSAS